jgi:uncharacterized protein YbbC (DUF1343 family)
MKYLVFLLLPACILAASMTRDPVKAESDPHARIRTGASRISSYLPLLQGKRVALLINATSLVGRSNLLDTLLKLHVHVVRVFSPEHGFRGLADAGATVNNSVDSATGVPVISLYGPHTSPSVRELSDVDLMIYDIQDVGVRFYTYISSMQRFLEAAADNHLPVIILDRPDPNGFCVDGPVLDTANRSFVGLQPVPIAYGMTIGEYAMMLNGEHWLSGGVHCDLKIIPCLNYSHHSVYTLPTKPSPNLPDMTSVYLYPSLCLFEGTQVSIGRGTGKPFQVFGAPGFPHHLFSFIPRSLPGATDPPFLNDTCYGYDLSRPADRVREGLDGHISLKWIIAAFRLSTDKEHFFHKYFNRLAGNATLAGEIRSGWSELRIRRSWQPGLDHFRIIRSRYLLYPL